MGNIERGQTELNIDVSVVVASYNPVIDKMRFTLDSIVEQIGVGFEIVIADDGSQDNKVDWIIQYMERYPNVDYKLVIHQCNQGTVLNVLDGVNACRGRYIKLISPGDGLYNNSTLHDWSEKLSSSGYKWSFGDAVNYVRNSNDTLEYVPMKAFPQMVGHYNIKNKKKCRWDYLILDDQILGAATLCCKELLLEYLRKLSKRVIYAEDNSYRIMMFDGIVPYYYNKVVIKYEFGEGISTSASDEWNRRLDEDLEETEKIMFEGMNVEDRFQQKVRRAYAIKYKGSRIRRILNRAIRNKGIYFMLKKKINMRMTEVE